MGGRRRGKGGMQEYLLLRGKKKKKKGRWNKKDFPLIFPQGGESSFPTRREKRKEKAFGKGKIEYSSKKKRKGRLPLEKKKFSQRGREEREQ